MQSYTFLCVITACIAVVIIALGLTALHPLLCTARSRAFSEPALSISPPQTPPVPVTTRGRYHDEGGPVTVSSCECTLNQTSNWMLTVILQLLTALTKWH